MQRQALINSLIKDRQAFSIALLQSFLAQGSILSGFLGFIGFVYWREVLATWGIPYGLFAPSAIELIDTALILIPRSVLYVLVGACFIGVLSFSLLLAIKILIQLLRMVVYVFNVVVIGNRQPPDSSNDEIAGTDSFRLGTELTLADLRRIPIQILTSYGVFSVIGLICFLCYIATIYVADIANSDAKSFGGSVFGRTARVLPVNIIEDSKEHASLRRIEANSYRLITCSGQQCLVLQDERKLAMLYRSDFEVILPEPAQGYVKPACNKTPKECQEERLAEIP